MAVPSTYRRPPRGRPLIGFELEAPCEVELRDGAVLQCREVQQDGRPIGELEVRVFAAALIIDRDGLLAKTACEELERQARPAHGATAVPVQLPGSSGYCAQTVERAALPYVYVFAMAPLDGIDGGVLVTVRSARPEWPAADHMLASLRILTRHGVAAANDDTTPVLSTLGLVARPRDD
jgi:hypothetical protein